VTDGPAPEVSIVICTYNNCESLRDTLRSIAAQRDPRQVAQELIVVDNNSADATRGVVEEFEAAGDYPHPVRYVFEASQGVAHARNTGVREARGEFLFFVDDDVTIDPGWLQALLVCFRESNADAVGTRIDRDWICPVPAWYSDEIAGCLIAQDYGPRRIRWTAENRILVTASLGFRRAVFDAHGMFRSELGRRGDSLVGGEDSEYYRRLLRSGATVMYEPAAVAFHKVERDRLSKDYLRRWFFEVGLTIGHLVDWRWYHRLSIAPFWVWSKAASAYLRHLKARARGAHERELVASELWRLQSAAILRERIAHWLPRSLADRACVFGRHRAGGRRAGDRP